MNPRGRLLTEKKPNDRGGTNRDGPNVALLVLPARSGLRLRLQPTTISVWTSISRLPSAPQSPNAIRHMRSRRSAPNPARANHLVDAMSEKRGTSSRATRDARTKMPRPANHKNRLASQPRLRKTTPIGTRSRTGSGAKNTNRRMNGPNRATAEAVVVAEDGVVAVEEVAAGAEVVASGDPLDANREDVVTNVASGLVAESDGPRDPDRNGPAKNHGATNAPRTAPLLSDRRGEFVLREAIDRKAVVPNGHDRRDHEVRAARQSAAHNGRLAPSRRAPLSSPLTTLMTSEVGYSTRASPRSRPCQAAVTNTVGRPSKGPTTIGMSHPSRKSVRPVLKNARSAKTSTKARNGRKPASEL